MKKKTYATALAVLSSVFLLVSCQEILLVKDISKAQVNVLAPTSGSTLKSGTINFAWQLVEEAEKYQIQIATPSFANATQIVLDSTLVNTSFSKNIEAGTYEWRVKALNSAYETEYTTIPFTITGTSLAQSTVDLVLPANNVITNIASQTLTWNAVTGATEYRMQIWKPDTNGTIETDQILTNTSKSYSFPDGEYSWQIRAQNATENSPFTSRKITIDTTPPNLAVLESPANNSTNSTSTVNFAWKRTAMAGSTESDSVYVYTDAALTALNFKDKGSSKAYTKTMNTGTYYWVVKSFDEAGNTTTNSNTFTFTIN